MKWTEIHKDELADWQTKLQEAGASLFQFPSWLLSFEKIGFFKPRILYCAAAYCGILELKFLGLKIALVPYGPFFISDNAQLQHTAIQSLTRLLKAEKFVFARFTGNETALITRQSAYDIITDYNPFPFYKEVIKRWVVEKMASLAALKTSFQANAKNKINKAEKAGVYRFEIDDEGKYMNEVYKLFKKTGERKGFSYRPLASYTSFFKNPSLQFASLYLCFNKDEIVNALLILRDKNTSLLMSSALDRDKMVDNISPAAYLHYFAMQHEFENKGTSYYDLVYSRGTVGEFKQSFNPVLQQEAKLVTVVFNKRLFRLYTIFILKNASFLKRAARQIISLLKK